MKTLAAILAEARARFAAEGLPDSAIEARLLVGGVLHLSSTELFTGGEKVLMQGDIDRLEDAIGRRLKREPVHRILGSREFHGMDLLISRETLEPRPDTEVLVDSILPYVHATTSLRGSARILDLGTGTGAILLALLKESPASSGLASDISLEALSTASDNAARLGLQSRFEAVHSHWFDRIPGRFDIIVSNPPYIETAVIPELEPEVRDYDPLAALDGGPDGLAAYREIAAGAGGFLEDGGLIGVEIGFDQKNTVTEIFRAAGFTLAQAKRDYGGNDRVLIFTVSNP